jgi:hypothetical protein
VLYRMRGLFWYLKLYISKVYRQPPWWLLPLLRLTTHTWNQVQGGSWESAAQIATLRLHPVSHFPCMQCCSLL